MPGRDWKSKELRAEEGEATSSLTPPLVGVGAGVRVRLDREPDSTRPLHPSRSVFSVCLLSSLTDSSTFTIVGLWPETNYEVKMSAVNGKGEGESSSTTYFKTEQLSKYPPAPTLPTHPAGPNALTLQSPPSCFITCLSSSSQ